MKTKKLTLTLIALIVITATYGQFGETGKQIFKSANYKEALEGHKTVAILPFRSTISYKRMPKGFDLEGNKLEEKKLALNMQQGMYTYLLRKGGKYTVTFQDIERTNILLKQAGVFENLETMLPDSLAKILNVDAVIQCTYAYEKTGSEAGAIAKSMLLGVGGKTGSGSLVMQIYNKGNGELIWRFYKEMNESFTSNANEVMERMMRKVSRNFPYEKD